jgi:hypothetical protein
MSTRLHQENGPMSIGLHVLVCTLAAAHGVAPQPPAASERSWTLRVGHESISVRDISRSGRPIETAPVGLEGRGVAFRGRYERATRSRAHVLSIGATPSFSGFAFVSPVRREPAPLNRASSLHARYEYRRYLLRDAGIRAFDVGGGLVAHAGREVVERHAPPANVIRTADLETGGGGSLNARLRRWSRVRIDLSVSALLLLGTTREAHDIDRAAALTQRGGGWRIESTVTAGVRVSRELWITGTWLGLGQVRYGSHRGLSERRAQLAVGVTHAR